MISTPKAPNLEPETRRTEKRPYGDPRLEQNTVQQRRDAPVTNSYSAAKVEVELAVGEERNTLRSKEQLQEDWKELEEDDEYIFYPVELYDMGKQEYQSFTMYKRVDKKIRPVSTTFSPEYAVKRNIPDDPLKTLPELSANPVISMRSHDPFQSSGLTGDWLSFGYLSATRVFTR
ncbi:hypothetical protein B0H19DRAFT_1075198 [Mycena capillaripes]|nr:hypothetical protein B0H19DRAFT_1075198 [Mycena capillaripes]